VTGGEGAPPPGPVARFFAGVTLREILVVLAGLGLLGGSHVADDQARRRDSADQSLRRGELRRRVERAEATIESLVVVSEEKDAAAASARRRLRALERLAEQPPEPPPWWDPIRGRVR